MHTVTTIAAIVRQDWLGSGGAAARSERAPWISGVTPKQMVDASMARTMHPFPNRSGWMSWVDARKNRHPCSTLLRHGIIPSQGTKMKVISTSPSGCYEVRSEPWEARMSHWVHPPIVLDLRTASLVYSP